jgi:hypothetical protein
LLYDEWRQSFDGMSRGAQRWDSRQKVYAWLAHRSRRELPTKAAVYAGAGVSETTFRNQFGLGSTTRLVDADESLVVAVLEAKEWSWAPYRHGLCDVAEMVRLSPQVRVEALVRAVAEWASAHPALSGHLQARPPGSAVSMAADALAEGGGDPDAATALLRAAVVLAGDDVVRERSLTILNALRPQIEAALGDAPETVDPQAHVAVVEALSDFAQELLSGETPVPPAGSEVRELLERLRSLMAEGAS